MQKLIGDEWVDCTEADLNDGDMYRVPVGAGGWQKQIYVTPVPPPDVFTTGAESVFIASTSATGYGSVYFGTAGDTVDMTFEIVDDQGALQTQLDSTSLGYPPVLALPVLKVANGSVNEVVDEVYFRTTLDEGVITVTGSFPASGNWKMLTVRINAALAEIGAAWAVDKPDVTFRINS